MIATELSLLEGRIIACCEVQVLLKVHAILLQLADEVIGLQRVAQNALGALYETSTADNSCKRATTCSCIESLPKGQGMVSTHVWRQ